MHVIWKEFMYGLVLYDMPMADITAASVRLVPLQKKKDLERKVNNWQTGYGWNKDTV